MVEIIILFQKLTMICSLCWAL